MAYHDRPKENLVPVPRSRRASLADTLHRRTDLVCVAAASAVATAVVLDWLHICC